MIFYNEWWTSIIPAIKLLHSEDIIYIFEKLFDLFLYIFIIIIYFYYFTTSIIPAIKLLHSEDISNKYSQFPFQ